MKLYNCLGLRNQLLSDIFLDLPLITLEQSFQSSNKIICHTPIKSPIFLYSSIFQFYSSLLNFTFYILIFLTVSFLSAIFQHASLSFRLITQSTDILCMSMNLIRRSSLTNSISSRFSFNIIIPLIDFFLHSMSFLFNPALSQYCLSNLSMKFPFDSFSLTRILIFKLQQLKLSYKNLKIQMNTRSLLACLLVLALFASVVQGLTIKKTQNHKAAMHMAKQFLTGLNHKMVLAFHGQSGDNVDGHINEQAQVSGGPLLIIPPKPDFVSDFTSFALGDDEVFASIIGGKPLSAEAVQRVKDFVKNNENFNNEMLQMFKDPSNPDCVNNLSEDQQRKIVGIIVDNMDFLSLLGGKSSETSGVSDDTVDKIEESIRNDPDLGDDVAQCYNENQESLNKIE